MKQLPSDIGDYNSVLEQNEDELFLLALYKSKIESVSKECMNGYGKDDTNLMDMSR